jgi:flagella basal body P-ring formation protein FlgA
MFSALLILTCCLSAPPEVTINTDSIVLGELIPFGASDQRATISLGFAPNPGLARRFQKDELLAKIIAAGFTTADLQLPDAVLVRRSSQTLNNEQAIHAVRDAFIRQYPLANIEVLSVDIPETQVGAGNVDIEASIPPHSDPSAPIYVKLDVRGNNFARAVYVRTVARVETQQPVIARPISAQSRIQPEDVEWKPMPLRGTRDAITSLDAIEGMVAKQDLAAGTILSTELLYMPVYVRKGDAVTVRANAGGVSVSATMRAKESGKFGESIVVEHLSGNGTATARVVGPRTLEALQGVK